MARRSCWFAGRCVAYAGTVSTRTTRFVARRASVMVESTPDDGPAGPVLCCFVVRAVGRGSPQSGSAPTARVREAHDARSGADGGGRVDKFVVS